MVAYATSASTRFQLLGTAEGTDGFAEDVRKGLSAAHKSVPPHHFYDPLGSALFEAICELPEYYVTRAERDVLTRSSGEIAAALGDVSRLVELGAGNARKTRFLLDALLKDDPRPLEYVPVDVDAAMLTRVGEELLAEYPSLTVTAVCGDFRRPSRALHAAGPASGRTAVLFLGSSIGNLEHDASTRMLRDLRSGLGADDALLLGVDLRKSKEILEPAYDDALGVTAAFNLNLLQRINRELDGHFDLRAFAHRAFYDEDHGRIEMHLLSLRDQVVRIDALDMEILFAEGEMIHTESSYKYDDATVEVLAAGAGFDVSRKWTDAKNFFADYLLYLQ